ncbi:MAG: hypothetical protein JST68_14215 [Bacteroidetes bacterium]|nr:hypothetical protein [Bacteroidota bacterium]
MSPSALIKLIRSLSSSEKRHFKLQSKMQSGDKDYLLLFQLIDSVKNPDPRQLKEEFKKRSPGSSWENTCIYLGSILVDCLVRAKKEKDVFCNLLHQLQEIRILKERSLDEEASRQARKVSRIAAEHQLYWIEYYCYRDELQHCSDNNFAGISDQELVALQMKGKNILKSLSHIHDHYSLYELLHYRLIHTGKIVSEEGRKKLNDLMLSEMVLVANKSKSFVSQKLHLLFQSFFFTVVGDYHSALKSFHHLNALLEKNQAFLDHPPLDYLSALTGIIESLYMLGNNTEAAYYLDKIRNLDQPSYPEYFRFLIRKTVAAQHVLMLMRTGRTAEARQIIEEIPPAVFDSYPLADEEKQCELYFYCSLAFFQLRDWKKAHLFLREIMNGLRLPEHLLISKAIRLLNIIIYYEKNDLTHLEYEIRSYKRYFHQSRLTKIEKLIFRLVEASPAARRQLCLPSGNRKVVADLDAVTKDRYEQQLLRYIDLAGWVKNRLIPAQAHT